MGIFSSAKKSKTDLLDPKSKSYYGYGLKLKKISVESITSKKNPYFSEKSAMLRELSGAEPVEVVLILSNTNKNKGRLTTKQVKEILFDLGFNVDVAVGGSHHSDISAVLNINGFLIPGWKFLSRLVTIPFPKLEKLFMTRMAPGKERLHTRVFEGSDGSWMITSHTEWNWMTVNLYKVFNSHFTKGAGDYKTGSMMMMELFDRFLHSYRENKPFSVDEIEKVTRWAYYQSVADGLKEKLHLALV
ncbi:hypothetical protein ACFL1M_04155 [Patescibacteria group bacterium]